MKEVVERRGSLALVRSGGGFVWTLPLPGGDVWYWHPDEKQWTVRPCVSPSPERAAEGLKLADLQATGASRRL